MPAEKTTTGGREPQRYELRVPIGTTMMQAFPTLAPARSGQDTLLTSSLPDQCALYGVIHQPEALGLQLLDPVRCEAARLSITQRRRPGAVDLREKGASDEADHVSPRRAVLV